MQIKKFVVLAVLFLLPITVYIFFASGKDNFVNLPILSYGITELTDFHTVSGDSLKLENRITVLSFFGNDLESKKANAFNLAHKIYKKNYQFSEFQFVTLITESQKEEAVELKKKLKEIEDPRNWKFAVGSSEAIEKVFNSLKSEYALDSQSATDFVFIIDKDRNLRGRNDDEDVGRLFGFDASNYAEINNKMSDDIKVVLAEYRLELKKYKANRKDEFRDRNLK